MCGKACSTHRALAAAAAVWRGYLWPRGVAAQKRRHSGVCTLALLHQHRERGIRMTSHHKGTDNQEKHRREKEQREATSATFSSPY